MPALPKYRNPLASVWRDIAIALVVAFISGWLSAAFEVHETLFEWSRRFEHIELDEWPVAVFAFSICLVLLYAMRHRQLRAALVDNRRLARQALAAQEEERRRLARELHDELGQYLNAIQLDARTLMNADAGSAPQDAAARISGNATHVYGVVSNLVRRLRPAALDELGLVAAIEACVDRARMQHPALVARLTFVGEWDGLDESINLAVYRIVQESLTNCVRHSGAQSVDISLSREAPHTTLQLRIADQGTGFDAQGALAAGGGVAGIQERVQLLGGSLEVLSEPGQGATIRVLLPASGSAA